MCVCVCVYVCVCVCVCERERERERESLYACALLLANIGLSHSQYCTAFSIPVLLVVIYFVTLTIVFLCAHLCVVVVLCLRGVYLYCDDRYRDQIVTCDVGVSLHSKTHPLFMTYSNGTSIQFYAYHYQSLFPVLFLQSLY